MKIRQKKGVSLGVSWSFGPGFVEKTSRKVSSPWGGFGHLCRGFLLAGVFPHLGLPNFLNKFAMGLTSRSALETPYSGPDFGWKVGGSALELVMEGMKFELHFVEFLTLLFE